VFVPDLLHVVPYNFIFNNRIQHLELLQKGFQLFILALVLSSVYHHDLTFLVP
jgi:hypothetical protein